MTLRHLSDCGGKINRHSTRRLPQVSITDMPRPPREADHGPTRSRREGVTATRELAVGDRWHPLQGEDRARFP